MAEMREKLMHFFDIGDGTENYVLLGDGISSLTEEFNPENETKHYIHQSSGTANVKSYAPSMSVEKEYIKDEELQKWIDKKVRELPTGASARSSYVRVNVLEEPVSDGVWPAVKRACAYQFDSIGGEGGSELVNAMTLSGVGDGIQGSFNVSTRKFTPGSGE